MNRKNFRPGRRFVDLGYILSCHGDRTAFQKLCCPSVNDNDLWIVLVNCSIHLLTPDGIAGYIQPRLIYRIKNKVKDYEINGFKFIGSSNLRMYSQDLGGCISTLDMGGIPVKKPKKLYHIITDSKFFRINGTIFLDYNGGLETILWRNEAVDIDN